ncbi:shikimate dehydrogenase [Devosia sp. A16]|uniref:shikimate dehydrogenase n=1 Tax=Devosia sp. A16 TaxID=1736675 RepID=UPI0006D7A59D|nr:shikimate dehydrogenase [Devosia sp. A16]
MKKAFVIGHPIKHSRSPLIHGSWIAEHGIDGSYEAIDVAPENLPAFMERLRAGEFVGGNVTIPHKEAVFAVCDSVDPLARTIGAVNTLVRLPDGRIHGFNTDYMGFLGNLDQNAPGWDGGAAPALVLGAGGAARAILVALQSRSIPIILLNRTRATADRLASELGGDIIIGALDEVNSAAPLAELVVNTTSIGMHGTRFEDFDLDVLRPETLVTDIVYVPLVTPLLADARARGLRTVDGLGMLLHQALPGFEAWFGVRPEVTPGLRAKVEATL